MPNTRRFRNDIAHDRLKEVLSYDPLTGAFMWLARRGRQALGTNAGTTQNEGYVVIRVDGVRYLAQRLAWFYMTGKWPKAQVDHKNRKRGDNRWGNLREANQAQQNLNSTRKARDLPRGVHRHRRRFIAITTREHSGKRTVRIGSFETAEEARRAWLDYMVAAHGPEFLEEEIANG